MLLMGGCDGSRTYEVAEVAQFEYCTVLLFNLFPLFLPTHPPTVPTTGRRRPPAAPRTRLGPDQLQIQVRPACCGRWRMCVRQLLCLQHLLLGALAHPEPCPLPVSLAV